MRRYARELALIQSRVREVRERDSRLAARWGAEYEDPAEHAGVYRKRKAYGCLRAHCCLCHGDKIFGIRSHKHKSADIAFAQELSDLD